MLAQILTVITLTFVVGGLVWLYHKLKRKTVGRAGAKTL